MPRQIHILFNLLALLVITYIVVDTFYRVIGVELHQISGPKAVALKEVEMRGKKSLSGPAFTKIVERNIFGATEKVEQAPIEDLGSIEILEETSLELSLLGTIAGDSTSARAIILDKREKKQDIYRVGDSVQEAEIRQILRGKVILRHGENDEILTMVEGEDKPKHAAKPAAKAGSRRRPASRPRSQARTELQEESSEEPEEVIIPIGQEMLQNAMNDINELMTEVRVRPYFRRGKPEGLIVSQIKSDSIFSKLGLMNGDIISSVNGNLMSSPEEAFQFYSSLKSGEEVSIEITRRGKKKLLTYDFQ
jgi:general secretion pathway protein C